MLEHYTIVCLPELLRVKFSHAALTIHAHNVSEIDLILVSKYVASSSHKYRTYITCLSSSRSVPSSSYALCDYAINN